MTRKDFELIADIIKKMPDHALSLRDAKGSVALAFAERLASINPRFNKARFLQACGAWS